MIPDGTLCPAAIRESQEVPSGSTETPTTDDESVWIQASLEGDRQAFARLVTRYWDRLYRWLYQLSRDVHQAEDLTQDSFLRAFAALASFRLGSNFRAWLFRIAHNSFINAQRAGKKRRQTMPDDMPDGAAGPVDATMSRETMELLMVAVHRLPGDFRSALLLRVEQELSFREIADILGITEETARWRVFKARQKLLGTLSPELLPPDKPE